MGLSIHYSGKFNKNMPLADFIEEVKEIAEAFNWDYQIFETEFPESNNAAKEHNGDVYGIYLNPPKCETVSMCFLSNYRMSCPVNLKFYGELQNKQDKEYLYMLSTKTQFAGTKVHVTIVELFRYLYKKKYFDELKITDEGDYWETGDEKLLEQQMKKTGDLIDNFSLAMNTIPVKQGEQFGEYFERIIKTIHNRNKKK